MILAAPAATLLAVRAGASPRHDGAALFAGLCLASGLLATLPLLEPSAKGYDTRWASHAAGAAAFLLIPLPPLALLTDCLPVQDIPWLLFAGVTSVMLAISIGLIVQLHLAALHRLGLLRNRIAIIGDDSEPFRLADELESSDSTAEIAGVFAPQPARAGRKNERSPDLSISDLVALAAREPIDTIVLAQPLPGVAATAALLEELGGLSAAIKVDPRPLGFPGLLETSTGPSVVPLATLRNAPIQRGGMLVKLVEDRLVSAVLIVLLSPVMLLCAISIRLEDGLPILYRQRRHGLDNAEFEILKFRTMRTREPAPSAGIQQTTRDDPRVTRVGRFLRKTSLDELPQLLNVLRGDMSLVGPRPHAVAMLTEERASHDIAPHYRRRHRVKPGITGLAQVSGSRGPMHSADDLLRRLEYDDLYIKQWSPLLDLKILAMTPVSTAACNDNAY